MRPNTRWYHICEGENGVRQILNLWDWETVFGEYRYSYFYDTYIINFGNILGACKWILEGHTAPVTRLRLDVEGGAFLSTDSSGRDRSIRLWNLTNGKQNNFLLIMCQRLIKAH